MAQLPRNSSSWWLQGGTPNKGPPHSLPSFTLPPHSSALVLPFHCSSTSLKSLISISFVTQKVSSSLLMLFFRVPSPGWHPSSCLLLSQRLAVHGLLPQPLTQSSVYISASQSTASRLNFHFHIKYYIKNTIKNICRPW